MTTPLETVPANTPAVDKLLKDLDVAREQLMAAVIPSEINLPDAVYEKDEALAAFIVHIRELRTLISEADRVTKAALDASQKIMLTRLEVTGQKNFSFEKYGTFSKSVSVKYNFPKGGKAVVAEYLAAAMEKGVVSNLTEVLDLQQSRLSAEPIDALVAAVAEYNTANPEDPLPEVPFGKYEYVSLNSPKKRK